MIKPLNDLAYKPRCSWLERIIEEANDRERRASMVEATPEEMRNLERHHRDRGYDPYNNAPMVVAWLAPGKSVRRPRARGW